MMKNFSLLVILASLCIDVSVACAADSKTKMDEKKIRKVAKDLQDVLATKILDSMYEGVKPNAITGGGSAEKNLQSLLNIERAKVIDLGLVDPITEEIKKIYK